MIHPSLPARPFLALDQRSFDTAIEEVSSRFDMPASADLLTRHKQIALPWRDAVRNHTPHMVGRLGREPEWALVRLGSRCFPIALHSARQMDLLPPVEMATLDGEALVKEGIKALYGGADALKKQPRLRLVRPADGESTNLLVDDGAIIGHSYAWAIWTVVAECLKVARVQEARKQSVDATSQDPAPLERRATHADKLVSNRTQESPGALPLGLGHNLSGLVSWRGKLVALTGRQDGEPISVRIEATDADGKPGWQTLPWPDGARLPVRGARLAIKEDTLFVIGGVDASGTLLDTLLTYRLSAGARDNYAATHWQAAKMAQGIAWPATAVVDGDLYICGGGVTKVPGENGPMPIAVRRLVSIGEKYLLRSEPPRETVGSCAVGSRGCLIVGPGRSRDGRVLLHDVRAGDWFELPRLPQPLGFGQVELDGDTLVYTGGYDANGVANDCVYTLDLGELRPVWKPVGSSSATMGLARWVSQGDRIVALAVTPELSARYTLG